MKLLYPVLAVVAIAAGCAADPKPAADAAPPPSVLDVSAPASRYQPSVSVYAQAPAPLPVSYDGPAYLPPGQDTAYVPPAPAQPAVVDPPAPKMKKPHADRSTYTVKPGDTLYHIAREKYGDGKKWREIAAANPDVSPTDLRVGEKLVMP